MDAQIRGLARAVPVLDEGGGLRTVRVYPPPAGAPPGGGRPEAYLDDGTRLVTIGRGCFRAWGTARVFIALEPDGG